MRNSIQNGFGRKKVEFKKIQQIYLYKSKENELNLLECFFLFYNILGIYLWRFLIKHQLPKKVRQKTACICM